MLAGHPELSTGVAFCGAAAVSRVAAGPQTPQLAATGQTLCPTARTVVVRPQTFLLRLQSAECCWAVRNLKYAPAKICRARELFRCQSGPVLNLLTENARYDLATYISRARTMRSLLDVPLEALSGVVHELQKDAFSLAALRLSSRGCRAPVEDNLSDLTAAWLTKSQLLRLLSVFSGAAPRPSATLQPSSSIR